MKMFPSIWLIMILGTLAMGGILGQNIYNDKENINDTFINYDNITLNGVNTFYNNSINTYNFYEEDYNNYDLGYIITETIAYSMKMFFRIGRIGIKIGYNNPEFNFSMFSSIIGWFMIFCLLLLALPALPLLLAIGYVAFVGIKKLIKFIIIYFKELFMFDDK